MSRIAAFKRGKDKAPRKKKARLGYHAGGGALLGGAVGNTLTKAVTVPIEIVGTTAGAGIGAGIGAGVYGARRAWRGAKHLKALVLRQKPEEYDYQSSTRLANFSHILMMGDF